MIKSIASNNDGDKPVRSELCHCGYVTADNEVVLKNYLVHIPSKNYFIVEIDVEEELNESAQIPREHLKCYWLNILVKNYH